MEGPARNPPAQQPAAAPSHESIDALLEMQHELDVANDCHPTKHPTWTPKSPGNTTVARSEPEPGPEPE